ncbi:MAG: hypothetical protein JWM27_4810 [Gemmatimonadetes bacterium]|nr:hypothetical protein [Gemmatimonadota bacterium]
MTRSHRPALALALACASACGAPPSHHDPRAVLAGGSAVASFLPSAATEASAQPLRRPAAAQVADVPPPIPRQRAPDHVRGIYVTAYAAASPRRMPQLLALADSTEINTFVVDVKDESGVLFESADPGVRAVRAGWKRPVGDLRKLADTLRAHDIWSVARIVVFKDPVLSKTRPAWSIRTAGGALWRDKAGNTWVSPWDERVWSYNLAVAEEAARAGFDEIQFDYVRFPEAYRSLPTQVHPRAPAGARKSDAIAAFLQRASERLRPLGVAVGADLFGLAMNDPGDVEIGQQWETLSVRVDHLYPMVYPSHYFPTHLPGVRHPNRMPYETVAAAVGMGVVRNDRLRHAGGAPARTIPWLQAFDAPWVDRHFPYGPQQARAQMDAVYAVGLEDWVFWNAASRYDRVAGAFAREADPRARPYRAPAPVLRQLARFEGWGMRAARAKAVAESPEKQTLRQGDEALP